MKYLPLVWAGIWRKRSRAVLLILQIATAFALFGTLQGLSSGIRQVIEQAHADRLFVSTRVGAAGSIPLSLLESIQAMEGVRHITPQANLVGTYQHADQSVPVIATNAETFFSIYDEIRVAPGTAETLRDRRTGGIVGSQLMRQYGWEVGDRVVLQTPLPKTDGSRDWTFDIVGTYEVPEHPENADSIIANFAYLNEARLTDRDRVNLFVVQADDPANAGTLSLAIDNAFVNSDHETRTQSEADRLAAQIQATADLDYIVRAIVTAVFFALLLATGALMMQSVRERTSELAVLKTLGFTDQFVLKLLLAESVLLSVSAALVGLALAAFVLPRVRSQLTDVDVTRMPGIVVIAGIVFATLLALISASAPALQGARRPIVHALSKR